MRNNTRISRINDEILKEVSQILSFELKDPRIGVMTSVTRVDTTADLKFCKIFYSVLGNEDDKKSVMQGLKNANGFVRHLLAERINLRHTPELIFKHDDSLEYGVRMSKLIDEVTKSSKNDGGSNE